MVDALAGKWEFVEGEKFDEYLKAVGVGMMTRTVAGKLKPQLTFTVNGQTVTMVSESTFKRHETTFTLGQSFDDTTADGREVTSTFTWEGGKLVQVETGKGGGKNSKIVRWIEGDQLIITCEAEGVVARRVYKRA